MLIYFHNLWSTAMPLMISKDIEENLKLDVFRFVHSRNLQKSATKAKMSNDMQRFIDILTIKEFVGLWTCTT